MPTSIEPAHTMIEALAAADCAAGARPLPPAPRAGAFGSRKFTQDSDGFIFINHSGPCSEEDLDDLGRAITATAERILGLTDAGHRND